MCHAYICWAYLPRKTQTLIGQIPSLGPLVMAFVKLFKKTLHHIETLHPIIHSKSCQGQLIPSLSVTEKNM